MQPAGGEPALRVVRVPGGLSQRVESAVADVVWDALDAAELVDQLGGHGEMVRDLLARVIALADQQGSERGVSSCTLGLRECSVRDVADQGRLEAVVVAVEYEEIPIGEPRESVSVLGVT